VKGEGCVIGNVKLRQQKGIWILENLRKKKVLLRDWDLGLELNLVFEGMKGCAGRVCVNV